jgi:hypothetical protein
MQAPPGLIQKPSLLGAESGSQETAEAPAGAGPLTFDSPERVSAPRTDPAIGSESNDLAGKQALPIAEPASRRCCQRPGG